MKYSFARTRVIAAVLLSTTILVQPIAAVFVARAQAPVVTTVTPPQVTQPPAPQPGTTTITVPPSQNPTAVVIPAQPTQETPAWLNAIAMTGIAIVMGLVGWGLGIVNKKAGLDANASVLAIEAHARDTLQAMLTSLAGRAIVELGPKINSTVMTIQNPTIRAIATAAPGLAGDAIKYFGLTPDAIAQKIIDKIGVLTASNPAANPTSNPDNIVVLPVAVAPIPVTPTPPKVV